MTQITDDMLTPWFPPEIKPVHVGRYQTECQTGDYFVNYWGRQQVHYEADGDRGCDPCVIQDRPWRGLKEKAE